MKTISIKKYDYIDAIRGFAILGVVLVHTSQWITPSSHILTKISFEGARGVQLFFLASALTLFLSLGTRKNVEPKPILSFFIRRFFRIAPAFYIAIIVYYFYHGSQPQYWAPNGISWWHLPLTAFFLHGWHPETIHAVVPGGWSIAIEMTFYLLVPILFKTLTNIRTTLYVLLFTIILSRIASGVASHFLTPQYPNDQQYLVQSFVSYWFFSQLPVFITGILLYHIIIRIPDCEKSLALLGLISSIFLLVAFIGVKTYDNLISKTALYGFAFLLFSFSLHYYQPKLLVNRLTILIGKLSFSIYLVHFIVLDFLKETLFRNYSSTGDLLFFSVFILTLILSIVISFITHHTIELPGISLGKRIVKQL